MNKPDKWEYNCIEKDYLMGNVSSQIAGVKDLRWRLDRLVNE